jgi:MbtH protein
MPIDGVDRDSRTYKVVINHEEQYSIWPERRANPAGWRDTGKAGTKQECLDHIKSVWTDMRPLSLRLKMANRTSGLKSDEPRSEVQAGSPDDQRDGCARAAAAE